MFLSFFSTIFRGSSAVLCASTIPHADLRSLSLYYYAVCGRMFMSSVFSVLVCWWSACDCLWTQTLANDQLDAQIFNTFITILYMYMFRAISCSSSGGQTVLIQHLVSSLPVSDRPVHSCTGRSLTDSDDTRCCINPLKPELNPICYLLALLEDHHFLHVSRIRVKLLNFRRLMSYIYGAPILDVSRSHTTTQHSR